MDSKEQAIILYHGLVSFMAMADMSDTDDLIQRLRRPAMSAHERVFREAAIAYIEAEIAAK
jgi:hypothetical protein